MSATNAPEGSFRYEIRLSLRGQADLDPIESWLKLNAKSPWKMEFQGMAKQTAGSSAQRPIVVFRFADQEDALRFQREGARHPPVEQNDPAKPREPRPAAKPASPSKISTPPRPSPRPAPRPAATLPNIGHGDPGDFMKGVGDLVRNFDQVMASKVQLIGLERVKEHFGDSWDRVAARADQIAERAIQKGLTKQDMMTKVHDLNYLVMFAGKTQEEAQLRCRMIANDIAKQLIGEDGSNNLLNVKTGVTPIDGDTLFEDTPSLDELISRLAADEAGPKDGVAATPKATMAARDAVDPLATLEFVYRPMWEVRRKVVTAFLCLPSVRLPNGSRITGENAIVGIDTEDIQRTLDYRTIQRATDDLLVAANAGRRLLVTVPVHFDTISTAARRIEYLKECRRLSPMVAKLLLFEVVGAPEGVPQSRVLELTTALRARSRAIMLRTPISSINWGELGQAGIIAVGADLSHDHSPEAVLAERFVRFADAAEKRTLRSYVHGLRSLSLTVSAVGAGFHYLSGQPIATLSDAPPDAHHFNLTDLYDTLETTIG